MVPIDQINQQNQNSAPAAPKPVVVIDSVEFYKPFGKFIAAISQLDVREDPTAYGFIQYYLSQGGDPNAIIQNHRNITEQVPLLIHALRVRMGPNAVLALINANVNINATDYQGSTALHVAVEFGLLNLIPQLISPQTLNKRKDSGDTPLTVALKERQHDVVRILMAKGASIEIAGDSDLTPLHIVAIRGELVLLPLFTTVNTINAVCIKRQTPLMHALIKGQQKAAAWLINANADINLTDHLGQTALFHAVANGFVETVVALLKRGAAVDKTNSKGQNALHIAIENTTRHNLAQQTQCVRLLLSSGVNPLSDDYQGKRPIIEAMNSAMELGSTDVFFAILERVPDLNRLDAVGQTLLHRAINNLVDHSHSSLGYYQVYNPLNGRPSYNTLIVRNILDKNPDLSLTNRQGETPAMLALRMEVINIAMDLIQKGAPLFGGDQYGPECVNVKNQNGNTLLNIAVEHGLIQIIPLLFAAGADRYAKNKYQQTSLDLSRAYAGFGGGRKWQTEIRNIFEKMPMVRALIEPGVIQFLANLAEKSYLEKHGSHFQLSQNRTELTLAILDVVCRALPHIYAKYIREPKYKTSDESNTISEALKWELLFCVAENLKTRTLDVCSEFIDLLEFNIENTNGTPFVPKTPLPEDACKIILQYCLKLEPNFAERGTVISRVPSDPFGEVHMSVCYQQLMIQRIIAIDPMLRYFGTIKLERFILPNIEKIDRDEFPAATENELMVLSNPIISRNSPLMRLFTIYLSFRKKREDDKRAEQLRTEEQMRAQWLAITAKLGSSAPQDDASMQGVVSTGQATSLAEPRIALSENGSSSSAPASQLVQFERMKRKFDSVGEGSEQTAKRARNATHAPKEASGKLPKASELQRFL